jgi:hypothetical protein
MNVTQNEVTAAINDAADRVTVCVDGECFERVPTSNAYR